MDLQAYLRALGRLWLLVAVSALVGALAGGALALASDPVYTGKVTFFATTPKNASGSALQGDQFGQQRVNTYVKLVSSQRLADRVLLDTGVSMSATDLMDEIEGSADLNTVLVTATVRDTSRVRTLAVTRAIADEFPKLVDDIETQGGTQQAPVTLDVVSGPSLEPGSGGHRKLDVAIGLIIGLVVGVALALLLALLDRKVRRPDELRDLSLAPLLGTIPRGPSASHATVVSAEPTSPRAEAFRQVRTNVAFVNTDEHLAVLAVTSPDAHDGRTSTATNLALAFAEAGRKVLLVDADLRHPKVAGYLGLDDSGSGLSSVLADQGTLDDAVRPGGVAGLSVLTSGPVPPNPSALLEGPATEALLKEVRESFDLVVLDTPALLPFADGAVLATHADGVVVVVRRGRTTRRAVEEALETLDAVDAHVLGTVLNRASRRRKH